MYLLTEEQRVNLEVLDNRQMPICTVPANLLSLQGEWATVMLSPDVSISGLRWGAWVRFWMGEGSSSYEVIGTIAALELQRENLESTNSEQIPAHSREALIRLQEFRPVSQRRTSQRHFHQTKILFRQISKADLQQADAYINQTFSDSDSSEWIAGICIDISPGGMRIRTDTDIPENEHILLNFSFDKINGESAEPPKRFLLSGRIIRRSACIRNSAAVEMAVKFDSLSVEDGMALSTWSAAR